MPPFSNLVKIDGSGLVFWMNGASRQWAIGVLAVTTTGLDESVDMMLSAMFRYGDFKYKGDTQ